MALTVVLSMISFLLLWKLFSKPKVVKSYYKRKSDGNLRYKMPPSFWDDVNQIHLKIYQMTHANVSDIRSEIDDFMFKWHQFCDFATYNERVSSMLSDFRKREKQLLTNNY